jgi:hypothetical protein
VKHVANSLSDASFQEQSLRPKRFILKCGVSSCSRSDRSRHANTPVLPICHWRLDCINGGKGKFGCPRSRGDPDRGRVMVRNGTRNK